eukprot:COSAG04_NODE_431_length_14522_cov_23.420717_2_plen_172_part_00
MEAAAAKSAALAERAEREAERAAALERAAAEKRAAMLDAAFDADIKRRAMKAEGAAVASALLQLEASVSMPMETEGDTPCDDSIGDQALPGYTPGWRPSMPSSPLSSPSVSVFGPGLGHQRDWGWDPGGVRAAGGGLGWDPGGGASGKRSAAVCGGVCAVGKGSLVGPPEV